MQPCRIVWSLRPGMLYVSCMERTWTAWQTVFQNTWTSLSTSTCHLNIYTAFPTTSHGSRLMALNPLAKWGLEISKGLINTNERANAPIYQSLSNMWLYNLPFFFIFLYHLICQYPTNTFCWYHFRHPCACYHHHWGPGEKWTTQTTCPICPKFTPHSPVVKPPLDPLQLVYQAKTGVEDAIIYLPHQDYSHFGRPGEFPWGSFFDPLIPFNQWSLWVSSLRCRFRLS